MPEAQAPDLTYVAAPAFVQKLSQRPDGSEAAAAASLRDPKALTSISDGGYIFVRSMTPPSGGGTWAFRQESPTWQPTALLKQRLHRGFRR